MRFFIPHLQAEPAAAEAEWRRYLSVTPAPAESRRVYSMVYNHEGDRYAVKVGEQRLRYRRRTGPRGGHIPYAEPASFGSPTGTVVSGIIDAGNLLYVWTYGPPFDGWANPSLVGRSEVERIAYFDDDGSIAAVG